MSTTMRISQSLAPSTTSLPTRRPTFSTTTRSLPPPPPSSPISRCPPPLPNDDPTLLPRIRHLFRSNQPAKALQLFTYVQADLHRLSPKILHSLLHMLVSYDIDLARSFYREKMAPLGLGNDHHTFGILMKGLCHTNRIAEAFKLLKIAKGAGFGSNPVIYNTLIHALCRNGKVGRARSLMGGLDNPSDVTFNIMISAYCKEEDVVMALVMLEKCFRLGLLPDVVAVTKILELLCKKDRVLEAVEVVKRVEEKGGEVDAVSYNALVGGFCRLGKMKIARRVVKEMEQKGGPVLPNVKTYNLMICGYCANGEFERAGELFREMGEVGIDQNFETFDTIIRFLCIGGKVAEALRYLRLWEEHKDWLKRSRIEPYNSVLHGLYKENRLEEAYGFLGRMRFNFPRAVDKTLRVIGLCERGLAADARKVFDEMKMQGLIPSVLVYAALICRYCGEGNLGAAFDVVDEMLGKGMVPMGLMSRRLIEGLCKEGEVGRACGLLEEMSRRRWDLDGESYGVVIEALCGIGEWERAYGLVEEMVGRGMVPDLRVWSELVESVVQNVTCLSPDPMFPSDHVQYGDISRN